MEGYMSVKEMGEMLGIKKTASYYLLNKGHFNVITVGRKMWVEEASFEQWYAGQLKYHKINGELGGRDIRSWTYSPREAGDLLGISDSAVYDIVKRDGIRTIEVDGWMRIPKEDLHKWHDRQGRYRIQESFYRDQDKRMLPVSRFASVLDIPIQEAWQVINTYKDVIETVSCGGMELVTEESFERFLKRQDRYAYDPRKDSRVTFAEGEWYLRVYQAVWYAGVSRQTITSWCKEGKIPAIRIGGNIRILLTGLERWLSQRKEKVRGIYKKKREEL